MPVKGKCYLCGEEHFLSAKVVFDKNTKQLKAIMICCYCENWINYCADEMEKARK